MRTFPRQSTSHARPGSRQGTPALWNQIAVPRQRRVFCVRVQGEAHHAVSSAVDVALGVALDPEPRQLLVVA
eukprot:492681-Rhodomonas_salina.1